MLASLGAEARTRVECFVADLVLRRGTLSTSALLLETEDAATEGRGAVDLGRERVGVRLRTASKRPTAGVLPVPPLISGTLKAPSAAPGRPEGTSGGIAGAPAALPAIRFGAGDDPRREGLVRRARRGRAAGGDAGRGGRKRRWRPPLGDSVHSRLDDDLGSGLHLRHAVTDAGAASCREHRLAASASPTGLPPPARGGLQHGSTLR